MELNTKRGRALGLALFLSRAFLACNSAQPAAPLPTYTPVPTATTPAPTPTVTPTSTVTPKPPTPQWQPDPENPGWMPSPMPVERPTLEGSNYPDCEEWPTLHECLYGSSAEQE